MFTASMEIYGAAVADKLDDNRNILRRRYFRQHCTLDYGSFTKDLSAITSDLSSIFILDNSPGAYRAYPGESLSLSPPRALRVTASAQLILILIPLLILQITQYP